MAGVYLYGPLTVLHKGFEMPAFGKAPLFAIAVALATLTIPRLDAAPRPDDPPRGEAPPFGETIEISVVEIPVAVTDRQGRPVEDLTREDFRVFEDGEAVEVSGFELVEPSGPGGPEPSEARVAKPAPGAPPVLRSGSDGSYLAVLLDETHLLPTTTTRILRQLEDLLVRRIEAADVVAVVSYTGEIHVLQQFTRDADELRASLRNRPAPGARAIQGETSFRSALREMDEIHRQFGCSQGVDLMRAVARQFAIEERDRHEAALRGAAEFVNSLGGLPGRKGLVYVTQDLAIRPGEELFHLVFEWCSDQIALREILSLHITDLLDRVTATANQRRVVVYAVDGRGLTGFEAASAEFAARRWSPVFESIRRANRQDVLFNLSRETGGRAILNANDVGTALAPAVESLDHYYLLAYKPKRPGDDEVHRLRVEVDRPGVEVHYPKTHRDRSSWTRLADRTLATLWFDLEFNPLDVSLDLGPPVRLPDGKVQLEVTVRVPLSRIELIPAASGQAGRLSLFVASEDERGRMAPPVHTMVPVQVALARRLRADEYRYRLLVTLAPDDEELAVTVWDELAGQGSFLHRKLDLGGI